MAWLCSIPSAWQISFANAGLALPANTLRRSRSCIILSTGFEAAIILASCALSVPAATARDNARGRPAKLETSVLPPTTLLRGKSRYHPGTTRTGRCRFPSSGPRWRPRSEEHTSELQSLRHLVCRLRLEKKVVCLDLRHRDTCPVEPAVAADARSRR